MLYCGRTWQPTSIDRVIETFPTSTRVAKVRTNGGTGFLKGMGNPAGNESLASELVGSELAVNIGLNVPPFALVRVSDIQIPIDGVGAVEFGPAFISREIQGETADGGTVYLEKLVRADDVALLVVFDTWVRNIDRCPPDGYYDSTPNRDNLLYRPERRKFDLIAIDHTHCFVEGDLETDLVESVFVDDKRVYGLFPEFRAYITERSADRAIAALRRIDEASIEEIVHSIPSEWGVTTSVRNKWAKMLVQRRERVGGAVYEHLAILPRLDV